MEIVRSILTANPCYITKRTIEVKGLMLHSVGCNQPSAKVFIDNWNKPDANQACVHAFIDGRTGVVYQTLPWNHRGWHCGGNGNNTHVGVEMCEPACLNYKKGTPFTCLNHEEAMEVVKRTYDAAVELFAYLCKQYDLNPLEDGVIISHKEGHSRNIASGHSDPEHLWTGLGSGYTMDGFRQAVAAAMQDNKEINPVAAEADNAVKPKEKEQIIRENDIVALAQEAVYYNGGSIPDWVLSDKWIIKSINGDRAVLGKNVSNTHDISSPVSVKYLLSMEAEPEEKSAASSAVQEEPEEKSAASSAAQEEPEEKSAAPSEAQEAPQEKPEEKLPAEPVREMRVSEAGLAFIARHEGYQRNAYKCAANVWTIGYGHTENVKPGDVLASEEEAKELLRKDLKKYGGYVNACIKSGLIGFPVNQNQFDALTSFCYNCGERNLKQLVKNRDKEVVAEKMCLYVNAGNRRLKGLASRREEERALFLKGDI